MLLPREPTNHHRTASRARRSISGVISVDRGGKCVAPRAPCPFWGSGPPIRQSSSKPQQPVMRAQHPSIRGWRERIDHGSVGSFHPGRDPLINLSLKSMPAAAFVIFCASLLASLPSMAQKTVESALVSEARELVDTYYGNRDKLERAAALLAKAHAENPADTHLFVQAARITVMGGHLRFGTFQSGTLEQYGRLLDKAIELDSSNAKAHILKAEVFALQGRFAEEKSELDKAQTLGTQDPWLQIGYGRYYRATNEPSSSYRAYDDVFKRGPGKTASDRKAYVQAVNELSSFRIGNESHEEKMRKYAALALAERYPTDAWTPLGFAEKLLDLGMCEDAIKYAREALKTMDFGAGRLVLTGALYARAAQLQLAARPRTELQPLLDEARKYRYDKSDLLEYLLVRRGIGDNLKRLEPALVKLIP